MKKLKRKIRRLINYIRNTSSKKYIIFVAVTVPILIFFIASRFIFSETESNSINYNAKVTLTDYNIKISYATYNTDTHSFEFTWFMTAKNDAMVASSEPEIYSVAVNTDLDTFIEYETLELSSTAKRIIAKDVPPEFEYLRVFLQSKKADTIVEDKYDEFGDLIEGYTIEGDTEYLEVHIDMRDVTVINNEAALTTTYVTFEMLGDNDETSFTTTGSEPATFTEPTVTPKVTTTTDVTVPTTVTTTTTASTTVTTITAKKITTTAKKTTTTKEKTTTTTAKQTTTEPKKTTTTTTTTTAKPYVELRGLKLSCPWEVSGVITLKIGERAQIAPVLNPENASLRSIIWESTDENVAVVSTDGKASAVSPGTSIIKCTVTDTEGKIFEVGIMIKVQN